MAIQVVGQGVREGPSVPERMVHSRPQPVPGRPRKVYFGAEQGWIETPILRRSDLSQKRSGPAIIEEYDATCLVPPGATAGLDRAGCIVISLET